MAMEVKYQVIRGKPSWNGKTYHPGDILKLDPEYVKAAGLGHVLGRLEDVTPEEPIPQMDGNMQSGNALKPIPLPQVAPPTPQSDKMFPAQPGQVQDLGTVRPAVKDDRIFEEEKTFPLQLPPFKTTPEELKKFPQVPVKEEKQITLEYLKSLSYRDLLKLRTKHGIKHKGRKEAIVFDALKKHFKL